jgi:hypothetical protein
MQPACSLHAGCMQVACRLHSSECNLHTRECRLHSRVFFHGRAYFARRILEKYALISHARSRRILLGVFFYF